MVIERSLTKGDYIRILLHRSFQIRTWFTAFLALLMVVGLSWQLEAYSLMVGAFVLFALLAVWSFYSAIRTANSPHNANVYLPARYVFSEEGVKMQSSIGQSAMGWSAFVDRKEVACFHLLYVTARSFHVIPKSAIPPQDRTAFETLLRTKIKKK